jgi:hypothetical protein
MRPNPRSVTRTAGLARRLTGTVLGLATIVTWAAGSTHGHDRRCWVRQKCTKSGLAHDM